MKLLSVEDARARMLSGLAPLGVEWVPLAKARGRFLAEAIVATRDQPPFPASAMDGWAVRAEDGEGPRRIVGESAAGHGFAGVLGPDEASSSDDDGGTRRHPRHPRKPFPDRKSVV